LKQINPEQVVNGSKFNRFHFWLIFWGFLIILFDGYDLVVYGTVVPVLIEEWNLNSVQAGAMGSAGLFGMVFGAIILGMLADRFGRKNVTILSVILFSIFTFLCGFADNPTTFAVFRFLAGLGLGGVMPNVIAICTEYAPRRLKSAVVAIVLVYYSVGGMIAPILGITAMPAFGWESLFWFAGLPLLFIPFIYKFMPESSDHLLRKGRKKELVQILNKVNSEANLTDNTAFITNQTEKNNVSFVEIFKNKRALSTVMFWITYFMSLLMVYGLNTWLPNLMIEAGFALNSSLAFLMVLQGGSIIGTILVAILSMKYNLKLMLVALYAIGGLAITLLGFGGNTMYIYVLVGIAGASSIGAQHLIQAYVSQYYPPQIRSTALGISSGIGRFGGMIGPMMGGYLLTLDLPIFMYFLAFAIPGFIAFIALGIVPGNRAYGKNDLDANDTNHNSNERIAQ